MSPGVCAKTMATALPAPGTAPPSQLDSFLQPKLLKQKALARSYRGRLALARDRPAGLAGDGESAACAILDHAHHPPVAMQLQLLCKRAAAGQLNIHSRESSHPRPPLRVNKQAPGADILSHTREGVRCTVLIVPGAGHFTAQLEACRFSAFHVRNHSRR